MQDRYIKIKSGNFDNYQIYTLSFAYCNNLISIDLSNFNFKKVRRINGFFWLNSNLEKIIWPNYIDSSSIIQSCTMFQGCSKLTSIDLSKFDFSKVTMMHYIFSYCFNLEQIKLPKNMPLVEDISGIFHYCNKLTSIDLSNFGFANIYNMSYLFYNCVKLNTIIWPEENCISKSSYCTYSYMFTGCYSIISIDLSNFYFSGVIDLSYMFSNCQNLQYIKLSGYLD